MKFPVKQLAGFLLPIGMFFYSCDGGEKQEGDDDDGVATTEEEVGAMDEPDVEEVDLGANTSDKSIAQIVTSSEQFSTLAKAVTAAGLAEKLSGEGPYTVYAPINEAFAELDSGVLEDLLKPENKEQLVELLSLHVVEGKQYEGDMSVVSEEDSTMTEEEKVGDEGALASDSEGEPMSIVVTPEGVTVDDADIITANIEAKNGVIHVISSVLAAPVKDEQQ